MKNVVAVCLMATVLSGCGALPQVIDWSDLNAVPFEVRRNLEIAMILGKRQEKTASLSLACLPTGTVRMLQRIRLPGPRPLKVPFTYVATLTVERDLNRKMEIEVQHLATGVVDIVVSNPLGSAASANLVRIFGGRVPREIGLAGVAESGAIMSGAVSGTTIKQFASDCAEAKVGASRAEERSRVEFR